MPWNGCEDCVSIGGDRMSVDVLAVKFGQRNCKVKCLVQKQLQKGWDTTWRGWLGYDLERMAGIRPGEDGWDMTWRGWLGFSALMRRDVIANAPDTAEGYPKVLRWRSRVAFAGR